MTTSETLATVAVSTGTDTPSSELLSLYDWLVKEDLGAGVRLTRRPPRPGSLGPVLESILVAVGPGGVAAAFASVLVAWLRRRVSDQSVKITRPDGTIFELTVTHLRGLDESALRAQIAELRNWLETSEREHDPARDRQL
jgi:hypothetical protein